jgi:hypothetical protein
MSARGWLWTCFFAVVFYGLLMLIGWGIWRALR